MNELLPVLFAGFGVSFLGQLPLGNLNVAATQIGVEESIKKAWVFSMGVALVEIIYLRIALNSSGWILRNKTMFIYLSWATVILFFVLGVLSIRKALKQNEPERKGLLIDNKLNRFLLGLMLSAINPMQIPFWFFWGAYFISNGAVKPTMLHFNLFTIGAGAGTLAGQAIYIHGGKWLIRKLKASHKMLNIIMGAVFIVSAAIQLYKIFSGGLFKD
ncbi:LysE family translocator [Parafilimonas sp.]|uniref:LysE family translocator n=1 Tax=Parafilimonas sp. TaxID=1969739 RepID=UPI0039E3D631